jgi:lysozyme family protein
MMKQWLTSAAALALMTNVALAAPVGPQASSTAVTMSTKALQETLNRLGATLTVDGSMGPKTTAAIADFQFSNGLQATGKLDRPTKAALDFSTTQMREDAQHSEQSAQPADEAPSAKPAVDRQGSAAPHMVGPASLGFSAMPDAGHSHIE